MDLKYLQKVVGLYGQRAKDKAEKSNVQLPNYITFPFIKIVEEIGEVADLLDKRYGVRQKISEEEFRKKLGGELSDVITFLIHIANFTGVDLEEAIDTKLNELKDRVQQDH